MSLNIQMTSRLEDPIMSSAGFSSAIVCQSCQTLKTLKLDLQPCYSSEPWSDVEPIILPNLTTLTLSAALTLETIEFVKRLHISSLKQLDIELPGWIDNEFFHEILKTLLRDCGAKLQSLGLHWRDNIDTITDIGQLLQLLPNLESLKFYSCKLDHNRWLKEGSRSSRHNFVNDELLSALSPSGKGYSDIVCPKLEVFECEPGVTTKVSEFALKEFVKKRKRAHLINQRVASLRHVSIHIEARKKVHEPNEETVALPGNSTVSFLKLEDA